MQVVKEAKTGARIQRYTSGQAGAEETCGPCHTVLKLLRSPPMRNTGPVGGDDACVVNIW